MNIVDWVQMSSNVFNILGILTIQDNPWPGLFCHEKDIKGHRTQIVALRPLSRDGMRCKSLLCFGPAHFGGP